MEKDSTSVISIESDEDIDTVTKPEAPSSSLNEKEPENEQQVRNDEEHASKSPESSADNATNDLPAKESDIICLDDEEKEVTEVCEERSVECLSATESSSQISVIKPPTERMEIEDVDMMEIAQNVEDTNCQQTAEPLPEQKIDESNVKESDIICLDDEEKETTASCGVKTVECLSATESSSQINVIKPPTERMEIEDVDMMEIAPNVEDTNSQQTAEPLPEQKIDESNVKESDIICLDDEEKETAASCGVKSVENFSAIPATSATEVNVPEPPTEECTENERIETMEIAHDVENKSISKMDASASFCQQTDTLPEPKVEEMADVQPATAKLETDSKETPIDATDESRNETKQPVLPEEDDDEQQQLLNRKRRMQKCINTACARQGLEFCDAPVFAQNLFKVPPSKQAKLICSDCFEYSVNHYESLCCSLMNEVSLYTRELLQDKMEEIHTVLDSSDEESNESAEPEPIDVEPALPADVTSLVDTDLNETIDALWQMHGAKHLTLYNADMLREAQENEARSECIDAKLKSLKATLQSIHECIYSVRTTKIDQEELIIEDDDTVVERIASDRLLRMLNENETLVREPVKVNETYYGVSSSILSSWVKCKVMDVSDNQICTVRFTTGQMRQSVVSAKHLAYTVAPQVKLKLGTRIIAKVSSNAVDESSRAFYAGTVLESISAYNKFRYLIIFDFGHTLYAPMSDVRVVCEQSKNIWDDVHPHSKEFIRNYMQTCGSMRPMVQAQCGQRMSVEINHKWYQGKVLETDSSLFRLYFQELNKYEWIYRGSKRLGPLYSKGTPNNKFSKFQRRNEPSIEYITIEDDANNQSVEKNSPPSSKNDVQDTQNRPTARKSTLQRSNTNKITNNNGTGNNNSNSSSNNNNNNNVPSVISLNQKPIYIDIDKNRSHGKTVNYTTDKYRGPKKFVPHVCNPNCLYKMPGNLQSYNLLARPLVTGWERHICHIRGTKRPSVVMYRAPCGRRLRDMREMHRYLRVTNCSLNVEHFDFEPEIRALATFNAENFLFECKDLSFGAEQMPVHCVNNYENAQPPPCEYSTERIPTEGVNLNLDKEFLCGCDCEDDCLDRSKCHCWKLTLTGALASIVRVDLNNVGYVYKRLNENLQTGIYECNVQCKCRKDKCLNRVVQNPLQMKLQVFNTHNKGWGIRSINDVPKGSFICIYAGHLLTDEISTKICELSENKTGDEYFADLDYIENAEKAKADFEQEAYHSETEETPPSEDSDIELETEKFASAQDSDEEYTSKTVPSAMVVKTRAQSKKASITERPSSVGAHNKPPSIVGVSDEQECVSLIPNPEMKLEDKSGPNSDSAFRKLYGDNDFIFVMDAKKSGNLGRYFNHSCAPNLFVQNVFVDTHDLRFPWVAFFASENIKAGTELTWDYNYDVGSVNGKVLNCTCGEKVCKGRLL